MIYNVSILDFKGIESEVRIYPVAQVNETFRCDDYGVIFPKHEYPGELSEDPFSGEEVYMKDLDELDRRAQESIRCSLSRTKTKVYQLCRGEDWEWFFTFTFSPYAVDRYDFSECSNKLSVWLSNMRRRSLYVGKDLKYMVVPEQHKDGAWHFHGIFSGVDVSLFRIARFSGHNDFRVCSWHFGYTTATVVSDPLAVSNYISKYITKDMVSVSKGKKRYWASRNLSGPKRINLNISPDSGPMPTCFDLVSQLGDCVKHISEVDTPNGKMTYLQVEGGTAEVLDRLWPEWKNIRDLQEV